MAKDNEKSVMFALRKKGAVTPYLAAGAWNSFAKELEPKITDDVELVRVTVEPLTEVPEEPKEVVEAPVVRPAQSPPRGRKLRRHDGTPSNED